MRNRLTLLLLALSLTAASCALPGLPFNLPFLPAAPTQPAAAPAPGDLIFEDDFSDRATGWPAHNEPEGRMDYDAGGYRMAVNEPQSNFWSTAQKDLADVRIEVDEGKLGGPDENRVGVICRSTGSRFYFFIITHDGYYGIGIFNGDQAEGGSMELIGQTGMLASPRINRGTNVNHLRADCSGSTLTLYVNGEKLAEAQDTRLTHGDIGLLAGTFAEPDVDVIFDNFVVLQP